MDWCDVDQLLVKEHLGLFKAASSYGIYDLATGTKLLECREPTLGFFTRMLRFSDFRRYTPFNVVINDAAGNQVVRISRGITILISNVTVYDESDVPIGGFKQKLFSIGGAFSVLRAWGQN